MNYNDVYALMNAVVSQATGQTTHAVVDTSSFVSVGETVLRTGTDNVLKAISYVLSDTIFSARPYRGKLRSLVVAQRRWGYVVRKITPLYVEAEASEDYNTDIAPNQLADGNSVDMYKIKNPKALQLNFYGTRTLQKHITRYRDQLSIAFQSEAEFMSFIDAIMVEWTNEIELLNENKTRALLCSTIAGLKEMNTPGTVVDLADAYNTKYSTTYTRNELLSTHLADFMKFMSAEIKKYSSYLTDYTAMYHVAEIASAQGKILRHTPKDRQKMFMYEPLFIEAESEVYSTMFNPQYLEIGSFEGVNYWQSKADPTAVSCKTNILNTQTGEQVAGTVQNIPFVLGVLFDDEAMGVVPQFDYASVTPFNSAGGYYNMYMHWRFNTWVDYTENMILFVIGAGGAPSQQATSGSNGGGE